jgi:diaminohydroxyphosphoribosylaminopyrimidine deaminase/5-amino-6-(5-phosphoribosylamino)uracil reductase
LPVLVATSAQATASATESLKQLGCECLPMPHDEQGISAESLLRELGQRRLTNVLVEGGSHVLGSFFDAGLIDEIHAFVAPKILGGASAPSAVAGLGHTCIADASQFEVVEMLRSGDDCLIRARRQTVERNLFRSFLKETE